MHAVNQYLQLIKDTSEGFQMGKLLLFCEWWKKA